MLQGIQFRILDFRDDSKVPESHQLGIGDVILQVAFSDFLISHNLTPQKLKLNVRDVLLGLNAVQVLIRQRLLNGFAVFGVRSLTVIDFVDNLVVGLIPLGEQTLDVPVDAEFWIVLHDYLLFKPEFFVVAPSTVAACEVEIILAGKIADVYI